MLKGYFVNPSFRIEHIRGGKGMKSMNLETVAFESAKISGTFQRMDIHDVRQFSSAYHGLEAYGEFRGMLTARFMNMNSDTKVLDVVALLDLLSQDLLNFERSVGRVLSETKSELEG